ncbi:nuclear transport factor 2 family protein [Aestuariibacter sp. A3R04]|uniref:nuclear transport factor 2 family protein n=1 Tax=Aestuariibacter sp. A3R04 TaxID=2841571 RepID=UPI001C0A2967|nr:nuclear transport factor 2 family protein [Aestuariibacter sp. A3R04]MBU3021910.1 nuclear transport factor 2 family protein [Aestuariibacter sp. A3R04]
MTIIQRFCNLYEALHTISPDDLETIYSSDVTFIDPITTHHGIANVKNYFSQLLAETEFCRFSILSITEAVSHQSVNYTVTWNMSLVLKARKHPIVLEGATLLKVDNDRIVYHRDYYDLGAMVYENIPILRWLILKIKQRLAS